MPKNFNVHVPSLVMFGLMYSSVSFQHVLKPLGTHGIGQIRLVISGLYSFLGKFKNDTFAGPVPTQV